MIKYTRVTVTDQEGEQQTLDLQVISESTWWLVGYEVERSGDEAYQKLAPVDGKERAIEKRTITERVPLRFNWFERSLEVAA
jgi:hypothetical protein